jgi:hypothetical protein
MNREAMKPTVLWFIQGTWSSGKPFLYSGGHYQRKDAIREHTTNLGRDWKWCQKNGDRAVKCDVRPSQ